MRNKVDITNDIFQMYYSDVLCLFVLCISVITLQNTAFYINQVKAN